MFWNIFNLVFAALCIIGWIMVLSEDRHFLACNHDLLISRLKHRRNMLWATFDFAAAVLLTAYALSQILVIPYTLDTFFLHVIGSLVLGLALSHFITTFRVTRRPHFRR